MVCKHEHEVEELEELDCEHECLHFCEDCRNVFCCDCEQEWEPAE